MKNTIRNIILKRWRTIDKEEQREDCYVFEFGGQILEVYDDTIVHKYRRGRQSIYEEQSLKHILEKAINIRCVHTEHCCPQCGCKYGDENCPVVKQVAKPSHKCLDCEEEKKNLFIRLQELVDQQPVPPEGQKVIKEHFWELI